MDKSKRFPVNLLYAAYTEENDGKLFFKDFKNTEYTEALRRTDEHDLMGKRLLDVISRMKPRYQEVLYYYFKYRKTYKEIGVVYGVTPTRIGQILHSAYRDLRKEVYADYVLLGKIDENFLNKLNINMGNNNDSLVNLHLCNRVYNALARAGIKDTNILAKYASSRPAYLADIRNLGKGGLKEIEDKLKERGLISEDVILKSWSELSKEEKQKESELRRLETGFTQRMFNRLAIKR